MFGQFFGAVIGVAVLPTVVGISNAWLACDGCPDLIDAPSAGWDVSIANVSFVDGANLLALLSQTERVTGGS